MSYKAIQQIEQFFHYFRLYPTNQLQFLILEAKAHCCKTSSN